MRLYHHLEENGRNKARMRVMGLLIVILILLLPAGCGTIAKYRREQRAKAAALKKKAYLESLPRCAGAEWFNECEPNFFPDFKRVKVFIEGHYFVDGKLDEKDLNLVKTSIKNELEKLGYEVDFGRNITSEESDKEVYSCSIAEKGGDNLVEVKHNGPLFKKLLKEDGGLKDYDALIFLKYDLGSISYQAEGAEVKYQVYNVRREKMALWSHYSSSSFKKKVTGRPYTEQIGNKRYLATPYWFVGDDSTVVRKALQQALRYLPIRSKGTLKPQMFEGFVKNNCKIFDAVLVWN